MASALINTSKKIEFGENGFINTLIEEASYPKAFVGTDFERRSPLTSKVKSGKEGHKMDEDFKMVNANDENDPNRVRIFYNCDFEDKRDVTISIVAVHSFETGENKLDAVGRLKCVFDTRVTVGDYTLTNSLIIDRDPSIVDKIKSIDPSFNGVFSQFDLKKNTWKNEKKIRGRRVLSGLMNDGKIQEKSELIKLFDEGDNIDSKPNGLCEIFEKHVEKLCVAILRKSLHYAYKSNK